jgi:hypothetical protein
MRWHRWLIVVSIGSKYNPDNVNGSAAVGITVAFHRNALWVTTGGKH